MASTIWKFPLRLGKGITMPAGARVLCVQIQHGNICLWALVDPKAPSIERTFRVFPTGGDAPPPNWPYIGTVQDGGYVWHIFEDFS